MQCRAVYKILKPLPHNLRIACVFGQKNIEKVIGILKRILSNIYDGAFVQKLITIKSKKASSITCIWESCKYTSKGILLVLEFSIPK